MKTTLGGEFVELSLAELKRRERRGNGSESGDLQDLIDHWIQAIDRWVQHVDEGMGGTADGADPVENVSPAPDPAPRPVPPTPPVAGAG